MYSTAENWCKKGTRIKNEGSGTKIHKCLVGIKVLSKSKCVIEILFYKVPDNPDPII